MKKIFFNPVENRLRAGWRIVIYFAVFLGAAALAGLAFRSLIPHRISRSVIAFPAISCLALGTLWLAGRYLDRRKFKDYGFHLSRRWWLDILSGFILGALLLSLTFLFEKAMGWVTIVDYFHNQREGYIGLPFAIPFVMGIISYIIVGLYEEILFRANLITNLAEGLNRRYSMAKRAILWAYLLSSVFFGLSHSINPNASLVPVLNVLLGGLFIGLPYVLSGELAFSIALHISWNAFQGLFFGFPVSGVSQNVSVIAVEQGGPELWTGGAFGPEGGLAGTVAIFLGCALICLWFRISKRPLSLFIKRAEYRSPDHPRPVTFS